MRTYVIPPHLKDADGEKVIGGILTMKQFGFITGGIFLAIMQFICMSQINKPLAIVLAVILACSGLPFAFVKIRGYSILKYLKYKREFNKKNKKLPNKRKF